MADVTNDHKRGHYRSSESKNAPLRNDCNLGKIKSRDSIIAT